MEKPDELTEPVLVPQAWKKQCRHLLDDIFESEDSKPFRQPPNQDQVSTYAEPFEPPMDLVTVRRNLEQDGYDNPIELFKDVQLIFVYAKAFSPNKRTKMNRISVRLSAVIEERMRTIIADYKMAVRSSERLPDSSAIRKGQLSPEPHIPSRRAKSYRSIDLDLCNRLENIVGKIDTFLTQKANSNNMDTEVPGTSSGTGLHKLGEEPLPVPEAWKKQCRHLLDELFKSEDSGPFQKAPKHQHDLYTDIFDPPMDLTMVKHTLEQNGYKNPIEFCKDVQLIFGYAKAYCPNKRVKMYKVTVRLSEVFEEHIWNIISEYRRAEKTRKKLFHSQTYPKRHRHPDPPTLTHRATSNHNRTALKAEGQVATSSTKSAASAVGKGSVRTTHQHRGHKSLICLSSSSSSSSSYSYSSSSCSEEESFKSECDGHWPSHQRHVGRHRQRSGRPIQHQIEHRWRRVKSEDEETAVEGMENKRRKECRNGERKGGSHQSTRKCVCKGQHESTRHSFWRPGKCREAERRRTESACPKVHLRALPRKNYAMDDSDSDLEGSHLRNKKSFKVSGRRHGANRTRASELDHRYCSRKQKAWEISESESDGEGFRSWKSKRVASSRGSLKRRLLSVEEEEEEEERSISLHDRKGDPRSPKQKCSYTRPVMDEEEDEEEEEEEEEEESSGMVQKGGHKSQKPKRKYGGSSSEIEEEEEEEEEVRSKCGHSLTLQEVEEEISSKNINKM